MSRQDMRRQHQRTGWIISAITAGVLLAITIIAVILVNMRPGTPNQDNRVAQSSSSVFTSSRQSKATNNQAGESTSTAQSAPDAGTKTVSDPSKYDYLSGKYSFSDQLPITIDFTDQSATVTNAVGGAVRCPFTKVLLHPDGSLVVNVAGSFVYRNVQASGESAKPQTIPMIFSVLIAPEGVQISKNWQTGTPITDTTDSDTVRLGIANTNDNGKTFAMSKVYTDFANNQSIGILQQY